MPKFLLPPPSSGGRAYQDEIQIWLHVVLFVALVLVTAVIVLFIWKYRRTAENPKATSNLTESHALEWIWTVIPTVFFFALFFVGIDSWLENAVADEKTDYRVVDVTAKQWSWTFKYADYPDSTLDHLYLEAGKKYKLNLYAPKTDVLHSFYMRSAGVKADVVPGRTNYVVFDTDLATFTANELAIGEKTVDIYCTEYCGFDHSGMLATAHILVPEEYKQWVAEGKKKAAAMKTATPANKGMAIFEKNCMVCHNATAEKGAKLGPPLKGKFGTVEKLEGGATAKIDENYLRESIYEPAKKVVAGYPAAMMPFKTLKDDEVNDLIAYIKSLK